jgi:hypothetical protein
MLFAAAITGRTALLLQGSGRSVALGRTCVQLLLMFIPWILAAPVIVRRSSRGAGGWRFWIVAVAAGAAFASVALAFGALVYSAMAGYPLPDAFARIVAGTSALDLATDLSLFLGLAAAGRYLAHQRRWREHAAREAQLLTANAELQRSLSEAQLQSLTSRVRPHFLYNALNAAVGLLRTGDTANAIEMLTGIAALFRRASSEHQPLVPIAEEMEMIQAYLVVERYRLGERMRVDVDIAPQAADVLVPALILQPLVENAVRHGIAERDDTSRLAIAARFEGDRVLIDVENDAPTGASLPEHHHGLGLRLTRERLTRHYGDAAELSVSLECGVVRARLQLPR